MNTKTLLYSIQGIDAEVLYHNYVAFLEEKRSVRDFVTCESPVVNAVAKQYLKDFHFKDPGNPSESITVNKFRLLVHLLISRNKEKGSSSMNAKILRKVIGPSYNLMLHSLEEYGIITISDYVVGKSATSYQINPTYKVKIRQNNNVYVQKELEKLSNLFKALDARKFKSRPTKDFIKTYEININKLKLERYDYNNFINQLPNSERSKVTYFEVINKLQKNIFNITEDERDRIYSTLTRTPKLLKNFLNIKFQVDVNNSHPLLFSYFIIDRYKIPLDIIQDIVDISYSNIIICHNGCQNLCNYLKISTQNFIKNNRIPSDVILYIYMTATGRFWDHFKTLPEFNFIPRYLIKIKLFEEVFYSNKLTSWHKEFAKAFKSVYPAVYSTILEFRKEAKQLKGQHLAHRMTRLESKIFREVLQRTWDLGMETVNIHDALVVLNTRKNATVTENMVQEIVKSVYLNYGLVVTTSTDYFKIEKAEADLQILEENQQKLIDLKEQLYQSLLLMTDDDLFNRTSNLLEGLDDGSIEVVFENSNPYLII